MKDTDRVSIHEAMEQQSISVAKAGIVTSLQARCAVIAAANPIRGKYNSSLSFSQNVNLSDPIISRFDLICVVRDEGDREADARLARFIVNSHCNSLEKKPDSSLIPQETLRKYVAYAREKMFPVLEEVDVEKISSLYASLRKESAAVGGIVITVRQIESIVRISEAIAKMHLRAKVLQPDIDAAIRAVLDSFCGTQRASVARALRRRFDAYLHGPGELKEFLAQVLREMLLRTEKHYSSLSPEHECSVSIADFKKKARGVGVKSVDEFLAPEALGKHGFSRSGDLLMHSHK